MKIDFSNLNQAIQTFANDVSVLADLQQGQVDAEANLATVTANSNDAVKAATEKLSAANAALQTGQGQIASDRGAVDAAMAEVLASLTNVQTGTPVAEAPAVAARKSS